MVGGFEIAGVPGIGDVTALTCPLHHERSFVVGIEIIHYVIIIDMTDAGQIGQIVIIGTDDLIVIIELLARELVRFVVSVRDTVLPQFEFGRRIDIIALFFVRDTGRGYFETILHPCFACQIFEDILRHRRTADIPVADEDYAPKPIR